MYFDGPMVEGVEGSISLLIWLFRVRILILLDIKIWKK